MKVIINTINLGLLLWIPFAYFTGRKNPIQFVGFEREGKYIGPVWDISQQVQPFTSRLSTQADIFRLNFNREKVWSFPRKRVKSHPMLFYVVVFFGLIHKNVKCFTKKRVLHVQLVPNIFKSRQRGFRSQSFRSEYLSHKFKSPLLWNISEERGILDPVWHSGDIYFVQTEC